MELFQKIVHTKQWELPVAEQVKQTREGTAGIEKVNLRRIATLLNRNYGTIYYTYLQLLEDLRGIVGDADAPLSQLFKVKDGTLRMALVRQSVPFIFLQHLLAEDQTSFATFIDSVGVSRVTCLRYLRPMRDMGKQLEVRIVYENMQIRGDETRLRVFLTLVYWLATDGAEWPFAACSQQQTKAVVTRLMHEFDLNYRSPVLREVLGYYIAVTRTRIGRGHRLHSPVQLALGKVPNLFADDGALTHQEQVSESQHLYLINFLLPLPYAVNDPEIQPMISKFRSFSPDSYAFAKRFLQNLPNAVLTPEQLAGPLGALLELSLLAVVMSVSALGFDLGSQIAYGFNQQVMKAPKDGELQLLIQRTVKTTMQTVLTKPLSSLTAPLTRAIYANFSQLRRYMNPAKVVRVALLIEPVALGFIDLVTFIEQLPFVEVLYDHYEEADLIIEDSSLELELPASAAPLIFRWDMNASSDLFGELFSVIHSLQQEKFSE
ncbi:MAG: helix-turn-helix domain-containing protein [Lactobacillus sp.]|nr:helix-turn-helix domain-containing protein [Lactobacillus sp.]